MRNEFDYDETVKEIFKDLKSLKASMKHEDTWKMADQPDHVPVLKKAYKTTLKADLLCLHSSLEAWLFKGCKIEATDPEVGQ